MLISIFSPELIKFLYAMFLIIQGIFLSVRLGKIDSGSTSDDRIENVIRFCAYLIVLLFVDVVVAIAIVW